MSEERLAPDVIGDNARRQLISTVERIERLLEEAAGIRDDVKEVFAEAKGNGFDTKTIRKCIRIRAMDKDKRQAEQAMLDLYLAALGDE